MSYLKNIAIVGSGGNIGSSITTALVEHGFAVTAITRTDSKSAVPPQVKVQRGDYNDQAFLKGALEGQDALVITLGVGTDQELQTTLIEAAAAAGVQW